jgi:hypothetical protein
MARHLTDRDISNVVDILDDWPMEAKLTWDRLVEAIETELKLDTTRQTLENKVRIKAAYLEVKNIFSGSVPTKKLAVPPSLKVAAERIAKQKRQIERLERENNQLLEQFHVWLYNAHIHKITVEQLSEPLRIKNQEKKSVKNK